MMTHYTEIVKPTRFPNRLVMECKGKKKKKKEFMNKFTFVATLTGRMELLFNKGEIN